MERELFLNIENIYPGFITLKNRQGFFRLMRKKIAVIGGGIFGGEAAKELAERGNEVTLYEHGLDLLSGASANNHLRDHKGYHYPRSPETVKECIRARGSFEKEYGACISQPFDHFQGLARTKDGSKTSPEDYLRFCDKFGLPYEIVSPPKGIFNLEDKDIRCVIKVPEYSYDPDVMRELLKSRLKSSGVEVKVDHKVVGGEIAGMEKILTIDSPYGTKRESFDAVVNATYSNSNDFDRWFGLPQKKVLYELVEMLELELPIKEKFGLSIFDGPFPTLMPRPKEGRYTLAHIKESILRDLATDSLKGFGYNNIQILPSNQQQILAASAEYYPILKEARIVRPIHITRVVEADVDKTDERLSKITDHGNGMYTVFSGKVVTCVDIARKLADKITEDIPYSGEISESRGQGPRAMIH